MRKNRRNLLAGFVAVAVLGGLVWLIVRSHGPLEPVYQGKRLSAWLSPSIDGTDDPRAKEAILHIGTNGIPTLLRMLRAHDSKLTLKLEGLAQKQDLVKIHYVDAFQRNSEAAMAFGVLGTTASNAVPALIQIFEDDLSVPAQRAAANALGSIGPPAIAAVPVLLHTAADTNADAGVRVQAVVALGEIHGRPELVVPLLIQYLKDPNLGLRMYAAYSLGLFGSDAQSAVPALLDSLKDTVPGIPRLRLNLEDALKAIDPEAAAKAGIK